MNYTLCQPKPTNPKFTGQNPSLIFFGKGEANFSFWKFEQQTNIYLKLLWKYDRPAILMSEIPTSSAITAKFLWQVTLDLAIGFRYKTTRIFTTYGQQRVQLIMESHENEAWRMSKNYASAKYSSEFAAKAVAKELIKLCNDASIWQITRR